MPPAVEGSALSSLGDTNVVLVDTPGFDDTSKPDYEIFEMVAQWLKNVSVVNFSLSRSIMFMNFIRSLSRLGIAGLIYLHRISDNRMAGTPLKNLHMFHELCGKKIMTSVTLVTTMWATIPEKEATGRQAELKSKYFKQFLRLGAKVVKFDDSQASAAKILEPLVTAWRSRQEEDRILSMVRLQKEVTTYRLNIQETSAARVVLEKIQAILRERQEKLDNLAAQIEANQDDPEVLQRITSEMNGLHDRLEEAQRDADRLRLEFSGHLKIFATRMRRIPHPLLSLVRCLFVWFQDSNIPLQAQKRLISDPQDTDATPLRWTSFYVAFLLLTIPSL